MTFLITMSDSFLWKCKGKERRKKKSQCKKKLEEGKCDTNDGERERERKRERNRDRERERERENGRERTRERVQKGRASIQDFQIQLSICPYYVGTKESFKQIIFLYVLTD
jgi:hypothetical protein